MEPVEGRKERKVNVTYTLRSLRPSTGSSSLRGGWCYSIYVCYSTYNKCVSCALLLGARLAYSRLLTSMASPSSTDGSPSMMNSHCQPLSPASPSMDMRPAARGAANTTLTTLAKVTAVKGLVRLQEQRCRRICAFVGTARGLSEWLTFLCGLCTARGACGGGGCATVA